MKPFLRHPVIFRLISSWLILLIPCISFAQPSDLCATATVIVSSPTCTITNGTLTAGATFTMSGGIPGCSGSSNDDVWYQFVARSTNPTITYTGGTLVNGRIQLLRGPCGGGMTSVSCGTGTVIAATGLTIGTTYFIRVYSTVNTNTGTFSICVVDPPPANDDCDGAISLTANTACVNTAGNMYAATASTTPVAPCTGPVIADMWYYFLAPSANCTITLSGVGASIGTPRLQLFSGQCTGLVSEACGTTSIVATTLTPNTYYYVRVYQSSGVAITAPTTAGFNICVTFTAPVVPPVNDGCLTATNLPVNITCVKTLGTIVAATASGTTTGACGGATTGIDVWYRFTATSTRTNIQLGDFGANYPANANRRLQIFTGTCAGLTSVSCVTGTSTNNFATTVGTQYFIRVWVTNTTAPTSFGDFTICVFNTPNAQRHGNTYVNITKQTVGGVVEPNDILEIRMTINHTSGTLNSIRYLDSVPSNTAMLTGVTDRLRVLSNEGIVLTQFTLAPGDDPGNYVAAPPAGEYQIRMNLNFNNTTTPPNAGTPPNNTLTEAASATGTLTTGNIPNVFGSALFATAFRVRVTGVVGDTITLGAGKFIYRTSVGGPDITLTATPYKILITSPMTLCPNTIGVNSSAENGGTFGTGTTLNRGTDLASPIAGYSFVNISPFQQLNDGQYAIVKNTSLRSGTNRNAERNPTNTVSLPDDLASANRMHGGHWDIDGDHTGTNDAIGNIPTADGVSSGYMVMVNADYIASETYRQTLNNLCPNTYYEFSAWFRNICPTCGNDYATGNNYSPRQPGVEPNLTFALDGVDRYSTGEIPYYSAGVTPQGWMKKGFVFITGPSQTSATFTIRNNSQGGGGNDWVMDDITVATCLPNMVYSPSTNPTICVLNASNLSDTVRSFYNNYVYYKWQRSQDGGLNYTDVTGTQGPATPTFNAGLGVWQYVTNLFISPGNATLANNGDMYRVVAATSPANLGSTDCVVTDGVAFVTIQVLNCGTPLKTDVLSLSGKLNGEYAVLNWTTSKEEELIKYTIEKSTDGINFYNAGTVQGYNNSASTNEYSYTDPTPVNGKAYYRIVMYVYSSNGKKYSRTIELSLGAKRQFALTNVVNPFNQTLEFGISAPTDGKLDAELIDMFGKVVKRKSFIMHSGVSMLSLTETDVLPSGTYILRISKDGQVLTRKVLKNNQF